MSYWVIIEAGGKQRFIFATNKRRANVGASQLVYQTEDRVHDAVAVCAGHDHGEPDPGRKDPIVEVMVDSGSANLIVPSAAVGRCLIEQVTRKALDEAPGLEVWGASHPIEDDAEPMASRGAAYATLNEVRGRRPTPLLANPMLPITAPCRWSGRPANQALTDVGLADIPAGKDATADEVALPRPGGEPVWVSREFAATYLAGGPGDREGPSPSRSRLISYLPKAMRAKPNSVLCRTDQEFVGWAGLVHADGDGMGALFHAIGSAGTLADLTEMNKAAAQLARTAVSAAVTATDEIARFRGISEPWLLPLIVGGDDVTVLLDGRVRWTSRPPTAGPSTPPTMRTPPAGGSSTGCAPGTRRCRSG